MTDNQQRARYQTVYGCAICGWSAAMGIHLPALTGQKQGQPWGHAYVSPQKQPPADERKAR